MHGKHWPAVVGYRVSPRRPVHFGYRFLRDTQIPLEGTDPLSGTWERIGDLAHLGCTGRKVEGPALFLFSQEQKWALLIDQPGKGGYFNPRFTLGRQLR